MEEKNIKDNENLDYAIDNDLEIKLLSYCDELKEVIIGKNEVFHKYRPINEIGEKILESFKSEKVYGEGKVKRGFYLGDGPDIGLISQNQGIQSLAYLMDDYGQHDNEWAQKHLLEAVNDVVKRVYNEKDDTVVFDASPYDSTMFNEEESYIDSITWTLSSILSVLDFYVKYDKFDLDDDLKRKLIKIAGRGLKYLVDSYIPGNDKGFSMGWNFTKNCKKPSLYFTYAVSEVYVDIYELFYDVIRYYELQLSAFKFLNKLIPVYEDEFRELEEKSHTEAFQKRYEILRQINGGLDPFDIRSNFYKLDKDVKDVGKQVWNITKNNLGNKYFNSTLAKLIDEEDIEYSHESDALFNTLFIINIVINGGIDDTKDIELNKASAEADANDEMACYEEAIIAEAAKNSSNIGSDAVDHNAKKADYLEKKKANIKDRDRLQKEYDDIFAIIKRAFENVSRVYNDFKAKDKEYIVDQYIEGFYEATEDHKEKAAYLRKKRIVGANLLPFIIQTNGIISKYLVKYPQYEMIQYLEMILKNRNKDSNGKYVWLWDNDSYSLLSTYNYIVAISGFYEYYDEYEAKFYKIEENNEQFVQKVKDDYKEYLETSGDIKELNNVIKTKNEKIKALEQELASKNQILASQENISLKDFLARYIRIYMKNNVDEILGDIIANALEQFTPKPKGNEFEYKTRNTNVALRDSLVSLLLSLYGDTLKDVAQNYVLKGSTRPLEDRDKEDRYTSLVEGMKKDAEDSITIIAKQLIKHNQSKFVETNGFEKFDEIKKREDK